MDSHSTTLILALVVLVILSAFFSATETAFSSLNRIKLKNLASQGNKRAKLTYSLSENYDELLSTILVGNNVVNIASTAIATVLFVSSFGGNIGPTLSTIVMTVVVLIFGEVSPKSLAKENAESFAMFAAPMLRVLTVILKPVNFLFTQLKKALKKLVKSSSRSSYTDSEILTIVEEAEQEGGIGEHEGEMLRNVIEFEDKEAIDIMTPRVDVEAVSRELSNAEIAEMFRETGYSRLPVYEETIDSIVGTIHEKDFYSTLFGTEDSIDTIMKAPLFIPPSMNISNVLKLLQQSKQHMAVIVDEFGGTEGVVTLEDVIEELVGEIWDEHDDEIEESFIKTDEGTHLIACSSDLDDLFDFYNISYETEASTVNGWITEMLDRIPQEGDFFEFEGLLITVTKMDNNRAEEISVKGDPLPDRTDEDEE